MRRRNSITRHYIIWIAKWITQIMNKFATCKNAFISIIILKDTFMKVLSHILLVWSKGYVHRLTLIETLTQLLYTLRPSYIRVRVDLYRFQHWTWWTCTHTCIDVGPLKSLIACKSEKSANSNKTLVDFFFYSIFICLFSTKEVKSSNDLLQNEGI